MYSKNILYKINPNAKSIDDLGDLLLQCFDDGKKLGNALPNLEDVCIF